MWNGQDAGPTSALSHLITLYTTLLFLCLKCLPRHSIGQLIRYLLCIRFTYALDSSLPSGLCLIELRLSVVYGTQEVLFQCSY